MITYGMSFVGTLTIEAPFVALEKLILGRKTHLLACLPSRAIKRERLFQRFT